jgi:hypothetical protein
MSGYVGYIGVDRQILIVGAIPKFLMHLFTDVVQCFNSAIAVARAFLKIDDPTRCAPIR